jgi:hypothetical protein
MRKREVNRKIGGGDPTAATASYHKSKIFLLLLILTASALVVSGRIQGESPIALIQIVPVLVAINIACLLVTLPGYFLARWAVRKVATKTN